MTLIEIDSHQTIDLHFVAFEAHPVSVSVLIPCWHVLLIDEHSEHCLIDVRGLLGDERTSLSIVLCDT